MTEAFAAARRAARAMPAVACLALALAAAPLAAPGAVRQPAHAAPPRSSGPLCAKAFRGQDPRRARGLVAAAAPRAPRCEPPDHSWRLAGEDRGRCCYIAERAQPIDGAIIDARDVREAEAESWRCSIDPIAPDKAVCQPASSSGPLP